MEQITFQIRTWEGGIEHSHQGPRQEKTSQKNDKMHTEKIQGNQETGRKA
jgi:hypothetical protein